jgi:hypothetical protein
MAGDWIKMRADLFTHPKVIRISSALKADNLRTVGGLMSVWCLFDVHSVDGELEGYTCEAIDSLIRWDGFSSQMVAVNWLEVREKSLFLPRFDAHNGFSAKRRAQDADRKREVRKVSAPEADKKRTREEKRREDKSITNVIDTAPSGVSDSVWQDFKKLRKAKKAAITETAITGIQREASKAGVTLEQALKTCCERGWTGFNADWVTSKSFGSSTTPAKYASAAAAIFDDEPAANTATMKHMGEVINA